MTQSHAVDDQGRTLAYGYLITGSESEGYRGRASVPLTASEAACGVREVLFATDLHDLLTLAKAELSLRSMVDQARAAARVDGERARGGEDAGLAGRGAAEVLGVLGSVDGP